MLHWKSQHFWSFSLDRQTRKNLKTDKFAEEVFDVFDWASTHKTEMIRYGAILVAVVVIGLGAMFYSRSRAGQREEALANALRIDEATVGGAAPQGGGLHYNSEEEKTKARAQAFAGLAKYNGTQEGAIAEMFLAGSDVDAANLTDAKKRFQRVVDDAPKPYASIARLALAQVYAAQDTAADAEKLLRDLLDIPKANVS